MSNNITEEERCRMVHQVSFLMLPTEYLKAFTLAETAFLSYLVTKQKKAQKEAVWDPDEMMLDEFSMQIGVGIEFEVLKDKTGIKKLEAYQIMRDLTKLEIILTYNEEKMGKEGLYFIDYQKLDNQTFNHIR